MPHESNTSRKIELEEDPLSATAEGKSWFLGIGINQYQHFSSLNNAVKDVKDLVELLQQEYDLLPEYTHTLYDEAATRRNIIITLDELQQQVSPQDKLLIYYSGHGHLNQSIGKGYWIPTDAERSNTADYIRNSTIREYIETFRALHTLLISDSCFSGSLFVRGTRRSSDAMLELATIPSRWAICSGRHDEEVYDGPPGSNSPFAESIMDTLRRNHHPAFNVAKLIDRVIEQTRSNYEQLPEGNPLYGVGHKGGQYIFRKKGLQDDGWADTLKANTISAYLQYLEDYPNGLHAETARANILKLEDQHQHASSSSSGIDRESSVLRNPEPPLPSLQPKPGVQLLAPPQRRQLRTALEALQKRTNEDAFLIIEEQSSGKFLQFAGGAGQELLFDLPTVGMDSDEISRAMEVLKEYGIGLQPTQYYTDSTQQTKAGTDILFTQKIGYDIDLAIELSSRVMLEVFGFEANAMLQLAEN